MSEDVRAFARAWIEEVCTAESVAQMQPDQAYACLLEAVAKIQRLENELDEHKSFPFDRD